MGKRRTGVGQRLLFVGLGALLGSSALAVVAIAGQGEPLASGDEPRLVAERRDHFVEREDGRRVAQVDASLWRSAAGTRLVLDISPLGPAVDPQPGFEGVAGGNRRSAEELTRLLDRGALSARAVPRGGGPVRKATLTVLARSTLPLRAVDEHRRLSFSGRTTATWVTWLRVTTGPLPPGALRVEVLVDGVPRLVGEVDAARGVLRAFRETGGLHRPREADRGAAR